MKCLHTHKHEVCGVAGEGRRQERRQGRGTEQRAGAGGQGWGAVVSVALREVGVQEGRVTRPCGILTGNRLCYTRGADFICKLFSVVEI